MTISAGVSIPEGGPVTQNPFHLGIWGLLTILLLDIAIFLSKHVKNTYFLQASVVQTWKCFWSIDAKTRGKQPAALRRGEFIYPSEFWSCLNFLCFEGKLCCKTNKRQLLSNLSLCCPAPLTSGVPVLGLTPLGSLLAHMPMVSFYSLANPSELTLQQQPPVATCFLWARSWLCSSWL